MTVYLSVHAPTVEHRNIKPALPLREKRQSRVRCASQFPAHAPSRRIRDALCPPPPGRGKASRRTPCLPRRAPSASALAPPSRSQAPPASPAAAPPPQRGCARIASGWSADRCDSTRPGSAAPSADAALCGVRVRAVPLANLGQGAFKLRVLLQTRPSPRSGPSRGGRGAPGAGTSYFTTRVRQQARAPPTAPGRLHGLHGRAPCLAHGVELVVELCDALLRHLHRLEHLVHRGTQPLCVARLWLRVAARLAPDAGHLHRPAPPGVSRRGSAGSRGKALLSVVRRSVRRLFK
jgi:hypothetical protein